MISNLNELVNCSQESVVELVSYDGSYPNLCSGTLVISIDGNIVSLECCLSSGGGVWFDDDWNEHVSYGPWTVHLPDNLEPISQTIEDLVNDNIPGGCCGGCI